jgi:hypothetical protein
MFTGLKVQLSFKLILHGRVSMSEAHGEHVHVAEGDKFGATVGVVVAIIGIFLAGVTIESHRAHTAAIVHKTEANDQWAYFQAKKIRGHISDVGLTLVNALSSDPAKVASVTEKLQADAKHYNEDSETAKKGAEEKEHETELAEHQALRFDLGEGLLELGLVLSSLYFLSKRKLFPTLGFSAALLGLLIGASGFFV